MLLYTSTQYNFCLFLNSYLIIFLVHFVSIILCYMISTILATNCSLVSLCSVFSTAWESKVCSRPLCSFFSFVLKNLVCFSLISCKHYLLHACLMLLLLSVRTSSRSIGSVVSRPSISVIIWCFLRFGYRTRMLCDHLKRLSFLILLFKGSVLLLPSLFSSFLFIISWSNMLSLLFHSIS